MHKFALSLGLLSAMVLSAGATFGAEDETKPKKGKFGEQFGKLKDKFGGKFGQGSKLSDEQRDKLFAKLDANSDGKISKEEFEKTAENLGKLGGLTGRMFERLDADNDGFVTKKEFEKFGTGGGIGILKDKLKGKFGKKQDRKDD